jgi:hypothetical protein
MDVGHCPTWMSRIQRGSLVIGVAFPAYVGSIETLTSLRANLAWYHRFLVGMLCLGFALVLMVLPGLVLNLGFRIVHRVRDGSRTRL